MNPTYLIPGAMLLFVAVFLLLPSEAVEVALLVILKAFPYAAALVGIVLCILAFTTGANTK